MKQPQRPSSRGLILALSASVVFHALLALFMLRAPPAPAPAHSAVPLEIIITETTRPQAQTPRPVVPPQTPSPSRPRPVRRPAAVASAPASQTPAQTPPRTAAVEPPPSAPSAPDAPFLTPPVAQRPNLQPSMPDIAPEPELPPEEVAGIQAPTHVTPEQMVRDTVKDTMAQARNDRGLVPPYFHELGQALFAAWHPEPAVEKLGPQTLASRDSVSLQDGFNAWRKRLETYGKSGSPLSDMQVARPPPPNGPLDAAPNFAAQAAMQGQITHDVTERRFALVRLTQDRRGRLVDLRLLKPSIHPEMDQAALRDFRKAGGSLPAPPEELLGSDPTLVSLWELELLHGYNTEYRDTSTNFSEALALASAEGGGSWFKHLRFAGSR